MNGVRVCGKRGGHTYVDVVRPTTEDIAKADRKGCPDGY